MSKLLLVVDYQNDFVSGALGFPKAAELDAGIADKIAEYSKNGGSVVCTLDTHHENYLDTQEGRKLPVPHCIEGTKGAELYGHVKEAAEACRAVMVPKPTFASADLIGVLRKLSEDRDAAGNAIEEIEVCGVVTNMCVISNAIIAKAALPEVEISILSDLSASFDENLHKAALDVLKSMQFNIK